MDKKLKQKLLFNPDAVEDLRVFGGETSNILDLSHIPKDSEIFHKLVDMLYSNNWLPHKVSMASDIYDYNNELIGKLQYNIYHKSPKRRCVDSQIAQILIHSGTFKDNTIIKEGGRNGRHVYKDYRRTSI